MSNIFPGRSGLDLFQGLFQSWKTEFLFGQQMAHRVQNVAEEVSVRENGSVLWRWLWGCERPPGLPHKPKEVEGRARKLPRAQVKEILDLLFSSEVVNW